MASMIDRYVSDLCHYAAEHNQLENYYRYALLLIRGSDADGMPVIPDELQSFLELLPEDDADAVILRFFEAARKQLGLLDVKIFSAVPLTFAQRTDIEVKLAAMFGKKMSEISLVPKVDKSLIGGLRIVVGNIIIDNTVKTRLAEMKKNVYKEVYLK